MDYRRLQGPICCCRTSRARLTERDMRSRARFPLAQTDCSGALDSLASGDICRSGEAFSICLEAQEIFGGETGLSGLAAKASWLGGFDV